MWKFLLVSFVLVVAVQHIFTFVYIMGYHKFIYKHRPGDCEPVNGTDYAVEDMELMMNGLVLIAATYLQAGQRVGKIFSINASSPLHIHSTVFLAGRPPGPLRPVGLSSFQNESTGKAFVFVVNSGEFRDCIEIFKFTDDGDKLVLEFVERKEDLSMRSVSDVLALGPSQFYFTNEAQNKNPAARMVEHYMMFPWGGVFLCGSGEAGCRRVSSPLFEPSGIHLSRDGKTVFISLLHGMGVHMYTRDSSDDMLSIQTGRSISLGSLVDSVFADSSGSLWTANHPVAYKYQAGQRDRRKRAPSQILHIKFQPGATPLASRLEVFEVYSDDGTQVSSSSSAIFYQGSVLIGSKRSGVIRCKVQVDL